jgi:Na+-transporting methylmalonyl-CoA/oxaloacetate decarboxylase gamma subunit
MLNTELFLETLPIMGKGMLFIFIVTAVIILSIYLLNKATSGKK